MKNKSLFPALVILTLLTPGVLFISCNNSKVDKNFNKVFEGRLERSPDLCMSLTSTEGSIKGTYFLKENSEKVNLTGSLSGSDSILINEFDREGNLFGVFKGKFVSATRIEGVWSKPDGSRKTAFFLSETNFTYDGLYNESKAIVDKRLAEEAQRSSLEKVESDKKEMADRISDFLVISKTTNNGKKARGIADLKVTVKNNSAYAFDKISVRVNYLDKKGGAEASENAEFTSIEPGATQTKALPDNKKAASVSCTITKATASAINFTYTQK